MATHLGTKCRGGKEADTAHPLQLWDVYMIIKGCEGIPRMDFVGHADPYVSLRVVSADGAQSCSYKTAVVYNTDRPQWNQEVQLQNVPLGSRCRFQVMDKDYLNPHEEIGSCDLTLDIATVVAAARSCKIATAPLDRAGGNTNSAANGGVTTAAAAASGLPGPCPVTVENTDFVLQGVGSPLRLSLRPAPTAPHFTGHLLLQLRCCAPCRPPGPLLHCGPVRYRVRVSQLAGAITGLRQDDGLLAFAAFKLHLVALPAFFPDGASVHWNTSYDKARMIFGNPAVVEALRLQHSVLYRDDGQQGSRGVLRGGGDLVALLRGGVRARQRRYYTYVLAADGSLYFSETGAAFFTDIMSKHAMHSGCATRVICAGEFCLVPGELAASMAADGGGGIQTPTPVPSVATTAAADAAAATAALAGVAGDAAGDWMLVVDNNSGTYAPPADVLPAVAALLRHNLRGLRVEALPVGDSRLARLQGRVPSRVGA